MLTIYRMMNRKNKNFSRLRILSLIFLLCALAGCSGDSPLLTDDLAAAHEAYIARNIPLTERLLERFLRNEQNPEKRWEAWNLLLQAINAESQEPGASLECLQAMQAEYENEDSRLAYILPLIGKYNAMLRHYGDGALAWSSWLQLENLQPVEKVEGYRQLAAMQFGQRHFEAGEDSLQQCMGLPLPDPDKAMCILDLANENMARERWQEVVHLCRKIEDSSSDESVLGLAGYLMGDALEQMGKESEALEQFEKYRNLYPNHAVMDNRIEFLRKNIKLKKDLIKKQKNHD